LGLGLVLTGLALAAAGRRIAAVETDIRRQVAPVDVVVASEPIPAGQTFSEANLAKKAVPASGTGRRNVPAKEFELLIGACAKNTIEPGEPVLWTDVEEPFEPDGFSSLILAGRRAITITSDATSAFAGLLAPGDRVDLLALGPDPRTAAWIRNLPVVAVDRIHHRSAKPTDLREPATVTLMVTPGEGFRIAAAATAGRLQWFLRNPMDNEAVARTAGGRAPAPVTIEIWKGGIKVVPLLSDPGIRG